MKKGKVAPEKEEESKKDILGLPEGHNDLQSTQNAETMNNLMTSDNIDRIATLKNRGFARRRSRIETNVEG